MKGRSAASCSAFMVGIMVWVELCFLINGDGGDGHGGSFVVVE